LYLVQSLNSPFFPPHKGAEPARPGFSPHMGREERGVQGLDYFVLYKNVNISKTKIDIPKGKTTSFFFALIKPFK